jgi:hypothetical protein
MIAEVEIDEAVREPLAPHEAEPLLGEAIEDGGEGQDKEDSGIEQPLAHEPVPVALLDSGHEVATDVAVEHVEADDRDQQAEEYAGPGDGLPADLAGPEGPNRRAQALQRLACGPGVLPRCRLHCLLQRSPYTNARSGLTGEESEQNPPR